MKREKPTIEQIRSRVLANPALAKLNPHLVITQGQECPASFAGGSPRAQSEAPAIHGKRRGKMNKTEALFSEILENRFRRGEIVSYGYEAITLRWGKLDNIKYTPDFTVFEQIEVKPDCSIPFVRINFIEVKGAHIWPKDIQKFKQARNEWPLFGFEMWQHKDRQWSQLY